MGFVTRLIGNLFRPPRTEAFPFAAAEEPKNYRGRIEVDAEKCVGCSTCAQVCIGEAIHLEEEEAGIRLIVWHTRCTYCGLCEFYCPTHAIHQTKDWRMHHRSVDKYGLTEDILAPYRHCCDCGAKLMVPTSDVFAAAAIGLDRNAVDGIRCEACRRSLQAKQIVGVKL